jgi:hypothetical protein
MTTTEDLTATVQRALLNGLRHHSKSLYGTVFEMPDVVPPRGEYAKITGHFGLVDVAQDIAAAVEASLPKPCACPK